MTNIGVTYRLKMVLGSLCPEEFPIADFNTEECVVQSATDRKTTYIVSSVVGIVALAAAVAAGWLYCRSRRLQNELKDLKLGSQMELIDLDSPVNKVYKFLDDVAKGHKRPKELAKEAGGLRRMLAASGGLLNPNLEEQLLGRYDEQTRLFLMDMIKEEGSKSLGQLASLGRKNTRQKFASDWNLVLRQLGVTSRGFSLLAKVTAHVLRC